MAIPEFKFALLNGKDSSFLPQRANDTDTGWDVKAAQSITIKNHQTILIPLGIKVFAPSGWWLNLRPRSSTFAKKNLSCLYGVIDEGYENQLFLACQFLTIDKDSVLIEEGERIGQLIPVQRQEMIVSEVSFEEFDNLCAMRKGTRGTGGFGSTG